MSEAENRKPLRDASALKIAPTQKVEIYKRNECLARHSSLNAFCLMFYPARMRRTLLVKPADVHPAYGWPHGEGYPHQIGPEHGEKVYVRG